MNSSRSGMMLKHERSKRLLQSARGKAIPSKLLLFVFLASAISMATVTLTRGFFQGSAPAPARLAKYMPEGALLYLESRDFAQMMKDWNASPEKRAWVDSDNYSVFSKSRLFLRLQDAQKGFAAAAGLPPDMKFLNDVAGDRSALAIYDIGNLELLYISHLPSARAMQSALWQTRAKFETRDSNGKTFYVREDQESSRTVAFAIEGDYLILATREDLAAGALELMAGKAARGLEQEAWFTKAVGAAAPEAGDLRMVMDLEKIAVTPHFRTYWIQQNITETAGYLAGVSDLYRAADQYREERILLRKQAEQTAKVQQTASTAAKSVPVFTAEGGQATSESLHFVPAEYGVYRAFANPTAEQCMAALDQRILSPHYQSAPVEQSAPSVSLGNGQTGNASDLETRIDVTPNERRQPVADATALLRDAVTKAAPLALLLLQSSQKNTDGVLLHISSMVAIAGASDWDSQSLQNALQYALGPGLSTSHLGVNWHPMQEASGVYRLDGLAPVAMAVRGKFLLVANDPDWLAGIVRNADQLKVVTESKSAELTYMASFNHANERRNFRAFTSVLDSSAGTNDEPAFFSRNVASLSDMFSGVASEAMVVHEADGEVRQTVTYRWVR